MSAGHIERLNSLSGESGFLPFKAHDLPIGGLQDLSIEDPDLGIRMPRGGRFRRTRAAEHGELGSSTPIDLGHTGVTGIFESGGEAAQA